jgi:hypothetical protein
MTKGYIPPLTKGPPQCGWPREYQELSLPLSPHHIGSLYLPVHMTEREWDVVMETIALVKQATLQL